MEAMTTEQIREFDDRIRLIMNPIVDEKMGQAGYVFDKVIQDYHKATPDSVHITDWDISGVGDNGVLDVTKLGL